MAVRYRKSSQHFPPTAGIGWPPFCAWVLGLGSPASGEHIGAGGVSYRQIVREIVGDFQKCTVTVCYRLGRKRGRRGWWCWMVEKVMLCNNNCFWASTWVLKKQKNKQTIGPNMKFKLGQSKASSIIRRAPSYKHCENSLTYILF